jgi:hypothetical protein
VVKNGMVCWMVNENGLKKLHCWNFYRPIKGQKN